ncbi:hypothetical protein LSUE1_G005119 [Lachnellula suecica]|uniref:Acyltransferase 3 domain-containing protein n=1 Tax=Lachnellula suecica TaxID=602035 RepID=A0A8T9C1T4_9HELO|nr:hypothetical protein LSUE1_G005119 [Lachnellula suecica]
MESIRKVSSIILPKTRNPEHESEYLVGLKGAFALQAFVWMFLQTFVPATINGVDAESNVPGPEYQVVLRKVLSVLFWNENLIYSAFIIISARCISIPFIKNATSAQVAGSLFRRGIRLFFPAAVSLALVYIIFSSIGYEYLSTYKTKSGNTMIEDIYQIPNALVYFNSIFNLFWVTTNYGTQAAAQAFPTQTLWVISAVFQQSYTVYMAEVIIPYTRSSWRIKGYFVFILTAFWVQSWAWFSITGLMLADMVHNMDYKAKAQRGIHIWKQYRCPTWIPCVLVMGAGYLMEYIYVAWRPEYQNREFEGHAGLYYSGGLNSNYDIHQPQARDDNYLILAGFMFLLESYDTLQTILRNPLLTYLGRRALSWFILQSIIAYTAGIKLWLHLTGTKHWAVASANVVCLLVCLVVTIPSAEIFHRLIDRPSQWLARRAYQWIKS